MINHFKVETKYIQWEVTVRDLTQISHSANSDFNLSELVRAHLSHLIDDLVEFEKKNQEELDRIGK